MDRNQAANRVVARTVAEAVGGKPAARRYYRGDDRAVHIDIATFADRPRPGVTTYATLGLSDTPVPGRVRPPLGVEVLGACDNKTDGFIPALAAIAFEVITAGRCCEPGEVFEDVIPAALSTTLRHAMLVPPFLWEEALGSIVVDYKTVAWLLAVPISDAEAQLRAEQGSDALETRFEEAEIDIFAPQRPSVV
ncbi:MAG: suppressor of fused domain protein [Actinomycetota bacterium]|nr:suppressor of fused domain protein [Actinomycetota bacterium]